MKNQPVLTDMEVLNVLSFFVDILSIIGFIISCIVLYQTTKIRSVFLRKIRIPEIVKDLNSGFQEINKGLKKYENDSLAVHAKIQSVKGVLENIVSRMPASQKTKILEFITFLQKKESEGLNEDSCWEVYMQLSSLISNLQQLEKDSKWEQS